MNPFASWKALVRDGLAGLAAAGSLPAGLDLGRVAVEPPRDAGFRRRRHQCRHGAGQARRLAADGSGRRAWPRRWPGSRTWSRSRGGTARLRQSPHAAGLLAAPLPRRAGGRRRLWPQRRRRAASSSTSSTARPTRPARCMSAMAAARCSATRWPTCWRRPATGSPANITSTTAGRRSRCWPARCTCATARRWARPIGAMPEGLYPGDYLMPVGRDDRRARRRPLAGTRRRPSGSSRSAARASRRCWR